MGRPFFLYEGLISDYQLFLRKEVKRIAVLSSFFLKLCASNSNPYNLSARRKEGSGPRGDSLLVYDYFIKDHLGNVRMVLTEEEKQDAYYAGFETADTALESQLFMQVPETQTNKPSGFDSDGGNQKVSKVMGTASSDKRVGPGVVLKVMAGDRFRASVKGWYQPDVTNPNTASELGSIVDQIVNAFAGGIPPGGNHGEGSGSTPGSTQLSGPLTDFVTNNNNSTGSGVPKAYLNWMVLDEEQFKLVQSNYGAVPIPEITGSMEKQTLLANGGDDIEVKKNGYLYVYVSNASKGNVYFDDLSVVHTRGPLLEETHYYPFGLTMQGISSKAIAFGNPKNKRGYAGNELQNTEFTDGGLELYDFNARTYDQQIGRFIQVDPLTEEGQETWNPYHYSFNNPIIFSDPDGKNPIFPIVWQWARRYIIREGLNRIVALPENIQNLLSTYNQLSVVLERKPSMKFLEVLAKAAQRLDELETSQEQLETSRDSYKKLIEKHKKAIEEFEKDPIKNSSEEWLKNAKKDNPSEKELLRRAKGRIPALQKQLKKQEGELKKIEEKLRQIAEEIKKIKKIDPPQTK